MFPAGADQPVRCARAARFQERPGGIFIECDRCFAAILEGKDHDELSLAVMCGGQAGLPDRCAAHLQACGGSMKITSLGRMGLAPRTPPIAPEERMKTCRFQL